jgi:glutaminyl-tRNA synthetase
VYIDKEDLSEVHAKGFFGLTPEQPVCLKYGPIVKLLEVVKKADGSIDFIRVEALTDYKEKLKGYIHWVSEEHSIDAELRLYSYLFDCEEVKDEDWEQHINPDSLVVKTNAKIWKNLENVQIYDRF